MPHYKGWLICSSAGNFKLLKKPICRPNEAAVPIEFDLPKGLFQRPVIGMKVQVDEFKPLAVTREMRIKAQEILEKELGVTVELSLPATCIYCNGTGVIDQDNGEHLPCVPCGGTGLAQGVSP